MPRLRSGSGATIARQCPSDDDAQPWHLNRGSPPLLSQVTTPLGRATVASQPRVAGGTLSRESASYDDGVGRQVVQAALVAVVDDRRNDQADQHAPHGRPCEVEAGTVEPAYLEPQHELAR